MDTEQHNVGKVDYLNHEKWYGFIKIRNNDKLSNTSAWFSYKDTLLPFLELFEGDRVTFKLLKNKFGLRAINIERVVKHKEYPG